MTVFAAVALADEPAEEATPAVAAVPAREGGTDTGNSFLYEFFPVLIPVLFAIPSKTMKKSRKGCLTLTEYYSVAFKLNLSQIIF